MARDRFTPDFDPDGGDTLLSSARQDIAVGRWQSLRDLLRATGPAWPVRGHRMRLLAAACVDNSSVESWLAAEPHGGDALVLRAATEVARAFHLARAAGEGAPVERRRVDQAVMACLQGAEAYPDDPTPWICLISVARLYPAGVRRQELGRWWDELHARDPYSMEGHLQVLHYYSARWHGSHGLMYDFARDAAAVAPPGSALPVLLQVARVEEYRAVLEEANGRRDTPAGFDRHWNHDEAVSDVRRSWQRWLTARSEGPPAPEEVRHFNYLAHAACYAGLPDLAGSLFRMVGPRASRSPWSCTGDPEKEFVKWRKRSSRGA
ncbi:hypothetical protein [Streptomyces sp. NBC_01176]|uniref:hypothetical protein n=1 Tax=Streptomyces sp. NBC_01176 TaxID=2903760 RepID=UPI003869D9B0|nr:hypothetical protein OG199_09355 [Streptomyces sp. NBC_01176]